MDGDIDLVVVLKDDADDLLVLLFARLSTGILYGHAHKATELADAKVDMHHIVADFHLLQFLHRQGHLPRTGTVGLEIVLMEAVKDLVIGKETHLHVVISKALVQGLVHWREDDA